MCLAILLSSPIVMTEVLPGDARVRPMQHHVIGAVLLAAVRNKGGIAMSVHLGEREESSPRVMTGPVMCSIRSSSARSPLMLLSHRRS